MLSWCRAAEALSYDKVARMHGSYINWGEGGVRPHGNMLNIKLINPYFNNSYYATKRNIEMSVLHAAKALTLFILNVHHALLLVL